MIAARAVELSDADCALVLSAETDDTLLVKAGAGPRGEEMLGRSISAAIPVRDHAGRSWAHGPEVLLEGI